jgi:antitoxin (DNA-binding transcriptional repressor) of toxin-antitoxin stability system
MAEVVVTEHDEPVASLVPALQSDEDRVLRELLRQGLADQATFLERWNEHFRR